MKKVKNQHSLNQLLLIPTCVALSVVAYQVAQMLKLPVYLDLCGGILAGLLGGPYVAMITAILTGLVNGMVVPTVAFFIPVGVVLCVITAIAGKYNMFRNVFTTLFVIVIMIIVGAAVSSPIALIVFGGATGSSTDLITAMLISTGDSIKQAVIGQNLIVGIFNNSLNVLIALVIIRKISPQYLAKTKYGAKYIRPKKTHYTIDGEVVRNA